MLKVILNGSPRQYRDVADMRRKLCLSSEYFDEKVVSDLLKDIQDEGGVPFVDIDPVILKNSKKRALIVAASIEELNQANQRNI